MYVLKWSSLMGERYEVEFVDEESAYAYARGLLRVFTWVDLVNPAGETTILL